MSRSPNSQNSPPITPNLNDLTRLAVDHFAAFPVTVDPKYQLTWFHKLMTQALERVYLRMLEGKPSRLILELPPRHGKSELATIKFPSWVLGRSPGIPIIVASYAQTLAEDFGQKTRDIMQDEIYQSIFATRLRQDSKAKGRWITKQGGSYTAAGVGGGITGRGFLLGIIDDPFKNREEADSQVYRDKVWDWYRSTFYTRQEGRGAIIVICTRWHMDDLVGRLEEQETLHLQGGNADFADEWEYLTLPAIANEDEEFDIYGKKYLRKAGKPLWPEKFSLQNLYTIENTLGPYEFSSLYQQKPIPSERQEFREKWFKPWDQDEMAAMVRANRLQYFTLCDPNASEEEVEANDEWVVTTIAKERNSPNIYRIEESAGKGDTAQMLKAIFRHVETYHSKFGIETVNAKALMYAIKEEQKKREDYFTIYEMAKNRRIPKEIRIRAMIPRYNAGVIYHMPHDQVYEQQLKDFPKGKHDDRIDAMANFIEMLEQFGLTDYSDDGTGKDYSETHRTNLDPYSTRRNTL